MVIFHGYVSLPEGNSKSKISFQLTFTGRGQSAGITQKAFASEVAHDLNKVSEHTSPAAPPAVPEKGAQHHLISNVAEI